MAKSAHVRKLLGDKLSVKNARLYAIAKDVSDSLSISTSDAILVLAAKNGINLHKQGIPASKVEQIRALLPHVPQPSAAPVIASGNGKPHQRPIGNKRKAHSRVKLLRTDNDAILDKRTLDEMKAMVPVYEVLYQLENSMRRFISRVMSAKHGPDWWNKKAPRGLQERAADRMGDDKINAWHQKRSAAPIDYLDLDQLPALVRAAQADFVTHFFPTLEWFQQFVEEVYRSRCVVSHMNPLIQTNVDAVHVGFNQWQQLAGAKAGDLKTLEQAAS